MKIFTVHLCWVSYEISKCVNFSTAFSIDLLQALAAAST